MKYLKVFTDFAADIEQLSDAEAGRLFRAMLLYAATGEEPVNGGNERFLWGTAKRNIDAQRQSYARKVESMEAARGQNPNNNKSVSYQTENSQETVQEEQSPAQDKDKDKDKGKKKKSPSGSTREPLIAEILAGSGEALMQAVEEWLVYKQEKRQSYQPTGLKNLLNKIKRYADNCGEQAVVNAIYDAMSSNYQGIVWDKLVARPQQPQQKQGSDGIQGKYNMMNRWANG